MIPKPWFCVDQTSHWDIVRRYPDGSHDCIAAAYFKKEEAWKEVARLRTWYPWTTFAVAISDY